MFKTGRGKVRGEGAEFRESGNSNEKFKPQKWRSKMILHTKFYHWGTYHWDIGVLLEIGEESGGWGNGKVSWGGAEFRGGENWKKNSKVTNGIPKKFYIPNCIRIGKWGRIQI